MTDAHLQGTWDLSGHLPARVPFHMGIAVRSIEDHAGSLASLFGMSWHPITEPAELAEMTPVTLAGRVLRRTHSREGPMRIELLEGSANSTWDTRGPAAAVHHLGYWSPNVADDVDALISRGWELEATVLGVDLRPSRFAYLGQRQRVARIELVAFDCAGTSWWPFDDQTSWRRG